MAKVYMKYTPARAGLTGAEFLGPFIDEQFDNVTWTGVISDGIIHYGYLDGTGDDLSKALLAIEGKFSVKRIEEEELVGFAKDLYNPVDDGITTPPTFIEFMESHGITITEPDELPAIRAMKKVLFKEVAKKKFEDYNDLISDLARTITLFQHHYADLDAGTQAAVDANVATLKSIYTAQACVDSFDRMVTNLQAILTDYYTACVNVDAAVDIDSAKAVTYDG